MSLGVRGIEADGYSEAGTVSTPLRRTALRDGFRLEILPVDMAEQKMGFSSHPGKADHQRATARITLVDAGVA